MTKIACKAFVPEGFVDSGWAAYSCYTDEAATAEQADVILRQIMRETEITKCNDVKVSEVPSIPKGGMVVDLRGKYVRTEGWGS